MNQTGHLKRDLIVVLNDNEMSISPNVGALSSYLNRLMTREFVNRFRDEMMAFLETLPSIGKSVSGSPSRRGVLKGLLMPGLLFENSGSNTLVPSTATGLTT